MSWTVTRPIAQFGLHTSVAVRAEQGRWDDTQKKYLSNLSKQTRQRTEFSHRAALPVMCYWKNAGGMKLWAQRDGHSIVKNVTLQCLCCLLTLSEYAFFGGGNLLWLTGRKNVETCDFYTLYCGSLFQMPGFFLFFFLFFPDSPDVKESQEVLFYVFLLKCLFPSIHGWGCFVCCHHPWFRECVESPTAWQLEEKRVATAVKAGCLLMSRPAEWMRTQMGFLSGGLFFWAGLSVVGDMGTPARIDWHLIEWGKT